MLTTLESGFLRACWPLLQSGLRFVGRPPCVAETVWFLSEVWSRPIGGLREPLIGQRCRHAAASQWCAHLCSFIPTRELMGADKRKRIIDSTSQKAIRGGGFGVVNVTIPFLQEQL
jgi:hypothetical protein